VFSIEPVRLEIAGISDFRRHVSSSAQRTGLEKEEKEEQEGGGGRFGVSKWGGR